MPEGISASSKTARLSSGPTERLQPSEEEEDVLPLLLEMLILELELLLQGEVEQQLQEANRP